MIRLAVRLPVVLAALALLGAPARGAAGGGRISVHVPVLPASLNLSLDGSSVGSALHDVLHAPLIEQDPDTLAFRPVLCSGVWVEDAVVLEADAPAELRARAAEVRVGPDGDGTELRLWGRLSGGGAPGADLALAPAAPGNPLSEALLVPAAAVRAVERGSVFTFRLREGVLWHDGHALDARDVLFSWELFANEDVRCDARRFQARKIAAGEPVDPLTVRFHYERQYFKAADAFASLCLLPSHRYDLRDPDHPRFDPRADDAARAAEINDNACNRAWVGLGPYAVASFDDRELRATPFAGYFDPDRRGRAEELRWRRLASDVALVPALLEDEIDFSDRLDARDVATLEDPALAARFRTGWFHRARYGFVAWNLRRAELADARVRRALACAFDFEGFSRAEYGGRALRVTGPQPLGSPGYDASVQAPPYDLDRAEGLMAEAGWIDRDGDGLLDREGRPLALGLLVPAGNPAGEHLATLLQEALARIGVGLEVELRDAASALARVRARDFDAVLLAWTQPVESDPEPLFHSRWAEAPGSQNLPGLADPVVDDLIERGQRELDPALRAELWRALHRRLDELQPYLFLFSAPVLYALDADVEGFAPTRTAPNYDLARFGRRAAGDGERR